MNIRFSDIAFNFARYITGLLFIFSGFIKANDPIGFAYKLEEYFNVFGLDFLNNASVTIAIILCGIEMILGALLLLGFWRKITIWGLLILIVFFTFLTFFSAYSGSVKSCGCFGDAIPLTPWQSFYKDLVLLILIGYIFLNQKKLMPVSEDRYTENIVTAAIIIISLGVGIYTFNFLPFFDFLPYKQGNNLPSLMEIPEGAVLDEFETIYHLENVNTGETKSMNDKMYLETEIWKDENWQIVGTPESRLINAGYQPPLYDLLITDSSGTDQTDVLLTRPGYHLLVVAYDLEESSIRGLKEIERLTDTLQQTLQIPTVLLTSSSAETSARIFETHDLDFTVLYADAVPLKSMVRANPGLILLKDGTVVKKWHYHVTPSIDRIKRKYLHGK